MKSDSLVPSDEKHPIQGLLEDCYHLDFKK